MFTVYLMQAAHTDIGYTHPQEQIGLMYLEHYDRVLELCEKTCHWPEPQRFKWTCETFWQVQHYLGARPERTQEFLNCVGRGQIEVTGHYLHFTDLIDTQALSLSLDRARHFCDEHHLPLSTAIHADINGWAWSLPDQLAARGIHSFLSEVHLDSATDPLGARGSGHYGWLVEDTARLLDARRMPVRQPQACWWEGPQGGRVLHWLGEHYLLGNMLCLSSDKPFGGDKTRYFLETDQLTAQQLLTRARDLLPAYLERLQGDGYPLDALLLSTGGYYVDNAPPDDRWLEIVRRWDGHAGITLRTCTPSEWFSYLRQQPDSWPTRKQAWPDHWAHGLGSETRRISQARRTARRRDDALSLAAAAATPGSRASLDTALEQERLSLEHTFNAWCSTVRASSPTNEFQSAAKSLTFHRAEMYLDESIGASLRGLFGAERRGELFVRFGQPGPHTVHFNSGDYRIGPATDVLRDQQGRRFAVQADDPELLNYVAVLQGTVDVPCGFALERGGNSAGKQRAATALGAPLAGAEPSDETFPSEPGTLLETPHWCLRLDPGSGGLSSLVERASGREWVRQGSGAGTFPFGSVVQERVVHPLGRQAVGNLGRFVQLGVASEWARAQLGDAPVFDHATFQASGEPCVRRGPVFDALEWSGHHERLGTVRVAWRAYHGLPLVELVIDWDKRWSELPEACYVAFPFAPDQLRLELDTAGGLFQPGSHGEGGQIPGSCSSYYTVQRGAVLSPPNGPSLCWLPVDAPLVMTQAVAYNRWETGPYVWNGLLASMPVNHYWHTNFPTGQRGELRLRYRLISGHPDAETALRQGQPVEALGWR